MQGSGARRERSIVLFDGVCVFCNAAVRFIARRDPRGRFAFAALDSRLGRELSAGTATPAAVPTTVVLLEPDGRAFRRSAAALRIARRLAWPWPLLWPLVLLPRPLRDALYEAFARRRYGWFGRLDACPVPPPELRERFLDDA